jgi:hypothetical protein
MDKAKNAATPSAIIGSILTAVTAIYQANDTSLEKKTYETLSTHASATQAEVKALNQRISTMEQALIMAALQRPEQPSEAPQPTVAAPQPAVDQPRRGEGTGLGSGFGAGAGRVGGSAAPATRRPPRPRVTDLVDDALEALPDQAAQEPAPEDLARAEAVAHSLGRDLALVEGNGVVITELPRPAAKKQAPLPKWNDLSE